MAIRAKAPEAKQKRLKMFVYGPSGVGKTTAAIMFPKSVIIDTVEGDVTNSPVTNIFPVVVTVLSQVIDSVLIITMYIDTVDTVGCVCTEPFTARDGITQAYQ